MKNLNGVIWRLVLCLGLLVMICVPVKSYAAKYFEVTARVKGKTAVEIGWPKKSVSGYEIYRSECDRYGNPIRYGRLAEVSGKKTKYVDKTVRYEKRYMYMVRAYNKKGSKKSYKFEGEARANITMVTPWWYEYLYCDGVTTPTSIELVGYSDGIEADAFEIYRKEGAGKYQRISTVKAKGKQCRHFKYEDKTVKKGKTYAYKVKSYKKIKDKKIYSRYSETIKLTAVNRDAAYTLHDYSGVNGKTKSIVVGLTSEEGNGKTLLSAEGAEAVSYSYCVKEEGAYNYTELIPVKYSYNNIQWNAFPEDGVKLLEYQRIYIMFEAADGKEFDFFTEGVSDSGIEWWLLHNNRRSILTIDFINGTAATRIDGESYH